MPAKTRKMSEFFDEYAGRFRGFGLAPVRREGALCEPERTETTGTDYHMTVMLFDKDGNVIGVAQYREDIGAFVVSQSVAFVNCTFTPDGTVIAAEIPEGQFEVLVNAHQD